MANHKYKGLQFSRDMHITDMHITDMHITDMHITDMHITDVRISLAYVDPPCP
jgi:hypothetical protein